MKAGACMKPAFFIIWIPRRGLCASFAVPALISYDRDAMGKHGSQQFFMGIHVYMLLAKSGWN
jgi:hypothetical protein